MHKAKLAKLTQHLSHQDPSKRRAAAEALSEGDERAVYPLIKALRDDNFGVQDAAIRSLMAIKSEVSAYMVLPLLREDAFLRNTAIIILREMGRIAIPLFYVLLHDKDDDVRKFILDLIYDIRYCDYPEKLVELLKNDLNTNVRASAARTLGVLNYRDSVPSLVAALKDDEWVCFSALEALIELRDESSVDSIVDLINSPSETIRIAAIEALGKIASTKAQQPLLDHLSRSDAFEKRATLISLIRTGTVPPIQGISDDLIDMFRNDDWDDKFIAMKGLLMLQEKRAIYHMIDIAGSLEASVPDKEEKINVIREAVLSFGCTDSLLSILEDENFKYRGKALAIEIAGDLKCEAAVSCLVKLAKSDYRDIKRSSIKSLGHFECDESREHLIEAISDQDSHVRKSAIVSLGKIKDMSAFEPLVKLLRNEKYEDVIDELIKSLLQINSTLFLSRSGEFSVHIQQAAARYASLWNSEVSC